MNGHVADVHLVDDQVFHRRGDPPVPLPVKGGSGRDLCPGLVQVGVARRQGRAVWIRDGHVRKPHFRISGRTGDPVSVIPLRKRIRKKRLPHSVRVARHAGQTAFRAVETAVQRERHGQRARREYTEREAAVFTEAAQRLLREQRIEAAVRQQFLFPGIAYTDAVVFPQIHGGCFQKEPVPLLMHREKGQAVAEGDVSGRHRRNRAGQDDFHAGPGLDPGGLDSEGHVVPQAE